MKAFFKSGNIFHVNDSGKVDGEVLIFVNGKLEKKLNYINGKRSGSSVQYYSNGNIKDIGNYKNDEPNGKEYKYYENKKLNYVRNWRNGKLYGDFYWYLENSQLNSYSVFDITQQQFCLFNYDKLGKIISNKGFLVSDNIYSFDYKTDSLVILNNDTYHDNKYKNIKDLYITVVNPVNLKLLVNIKINNNYYSNVAIKDNTIKIPNVFSKGTFNVFIETHLMDKLNKIVNGGNIKTTIIRTE